MEEIKEQIEKGKSFREFLEGHTDLLTIFAVFNGLVVFSGTIEEVHKVVRLVLFISFYAMSLLVWLEIIGDAIRIVKNRKVPLFRSLKFYCFILFAILIQAMLLIYFFYRLPGLLPISLVIIFHISISFSSIAFLEEVYRTFTKRHLYKYRIFIVLFFVVAFWYSYFFLTNPLLQLLRKFIPSEFWWS
jgi:hypothetical protein